MDVLLTNRPSSTGLVPLAPREPGSPVAPTNSVAPSIVVSALDAAGAAAGQISDPLAGALGVEGTGRENLVFLATVIFVLWKWF